MEENESVRKQRLEALFENLGEPAVQIQVLNPATTTLFPGLGEAEPTREEARAWLAKKSSQRAWKARRDWIVFWSAIIAAITATAGLFF